MPRPPTVFPGQRYGRLVVVREADRRVYPCGKSLRRYECICDCGETTVTTANRLQQGATQSCGCLSRERTAERNRLNRTHGHSRSRNGRSSPTFSSWQSMKARCYRPSMDNYEKYGGRGVIVCDRWREAFQNFLDDMGERPEGKTLDRIDSSGNYEPRNCRWATPVEQRHNRRKA